MHVNKRASAAGATSRRDEVVPVMREAQSMLCASFEQMDARAAPAQAGPVARFGSSTWERPGGGGGTARVLSEGHVFERAGVNVSAVHGEAAPPSVREAHPETQGQPFFATGISLVLHPCNPYVPAFHANFRFFEVGPLCWLGGGMDMTPCYGFAEDAVFFHRTLKAYCEQHPIVDYAALKQACDEYFFIAHRHEMRGIGGIFCDKLRVEGAEDWRRGLAFIREGIDTILAAYLPIVERRMAMPYGEREREWQLYRRGRYVEFNLVYDRGTVFGLQMQGNSEAILMSLPPLARWAFDYHPEAGSPEAALAAFLQPRDWAAYPANGMPTLAAGQPDICPTPDR